MKRLAIALMVAGGALFASGGAVSGQEYPPAATITPSDSTPDPGQSFTVTVNGCTDGQTVTFVFAGQTIVATCTDGTASAALIAPTTPGTASGTATFGDDSLSFSVVVGAVVTTTVPATIPTPTNPSGGLPGTGSDSNSTVLIAGLLLMAGVGMYAVSQVRRRQASPA